MEVGERTTGLKTEFNCSVSDNSRNRGCVSNLQYESQKQRSRKRTITVSVFSLANSTCRLWTSESNQNMGNAIAKLFDSLFGTREMRVVMLGLDAAGKTTVLYKLHIGEILSTVPTIGTACQSSGSMGFTCPYIFLSLLTNVVFSFFLNPSFFLCSLEWRCICPCFVSANKRTLQIDEEMICY